VGFLARILSYTYRAVSGVFSADIKGDLGGGENRTAQHFQPANMASVPLVSDTAALLPVPGAGRLVAVAFNDPGAPDDLQPGEAMVYARNSSGARVVSVKLSQDGSCSIGNANGGIVIEAGGNVAINGFIIDLGGNSDTPGSGEFGPSLTVDGKDINGHTHTQPNDTGVDTEVPTDPFS